MIKLRITSDGRVRSLWNDDVDFAALGRLTVRRASHVEFDARSQQWTVRVLGLIIAFWILRNIQVYPLSLLAP